MSIWRNKLYFIHVLITGDMNHDYVSMRLVYRLTQSVQLSADFDFQFFFVFNKCFALLESKPKASFRIAVLLNIHLRYGVSPEPRFRRLRVHSVVVSNNFVNFILILVLYLELGLLKPQVGRKTATLPTYLGLALQLFT